MSTVRKTVFGILAAIVLAGTVLPAIASNVTLKSDATINSDTIKLGDIFDGLPDSGDKVLGIAPQPGQQMVLNANTLIRIAIAVNLPWRPASSSDRIVVKRAASVVDRQMIERAVRLKVDADEKFKEAKYQVVLPDTVANINLSPDIAPGAEVTDIKIRPETGWFEASLASPSASDPVRVTKITGTIRKMVDVPVLRENLNAGQIINARDVDFIEIPEGDVRPDMIIKADALNGMAPRRSIVAGKPIKNLDVIAPQIIARGDVVTMYFTQGTMTLTASGKALENGAKGDVIRVVNPSSNKTIEGIVTASREVTVKSF